MTFDKRSSGVGVGPISSYGAGNVTVMDDFCALAFAIAPILQHYVGIVENAGFTVLLLVAPILAIRFFMKVAKGNINSQCFAALLPLTLFELYTIFVHGYESTRLFYVLFLLLLFFGVASGCVNVSRFMRYAFLIASASTIAIIIQYFSHYLLHRNLDFRFLSYLVKDDTIWEKGAEYIDGRDFSSYFYRPSGLFLEPSHFFLYSFPLIGILLLTPGINTSKRNKAFFLSLGLVLTTSGMGIGCVVGLWTVYFVLKNNNFEVKGSFIKSFSPRTIVIGVAILAVLFLSYQFIPVIHSSLSRVFNASEGHSAMDGRVRLARSYARTIYGKAVFFGTPGISRVLDFNLSGFYSTYFRWGVVGLFLTYWYYIQGVFKLHGAYFWISVIIVVVSYYSAHTHGTFYILYYMLFLMNGYYDRSLSIHKTN